MPRHQIEQHIADLRRKVRRLVWIHGAGMVVAASLAAMLVLGLADYLIHIQDRGIRVIFWLAALVVLGYSGWWCLVRPLTARLGDVELAGRLQRRFASLDDRLLSAVQFLRAPEGDPAAGSPALRQAVIAEAATQSEDLDFDAVLNRRPLQWAVAAVAAVGLAAAMLGSLDPAGSWIAAARLLDPFSDLAWPQTTHLALRPPAPPAGYVVARGQAFEIEAVDAREARLPAEVRIHYRIQDPGSPPLPTMQRIVPGEGTGEGSEGKTMEVVERMQWLRGTMVARRENVTAPFEFRVEGGDDQSMPWLPVEVIEPAAVRALAIELFPPEYTGWPAEKIEAGGSLRALVGTRVRMRGEATKPLRAAVLCLEGGREIPASLDPDGLRFDISPHDLTIEKSGSYWLKLADVDGLSGGTARSEIVAVADQPPTVTIARPAGDLFVTPGAVVPLLVVARDDLALRDVSLVVSRGKAVPAAGSATQKDSPIELYQGPPHAPPRAPGGAEGESGQRQEIAYRWELGPLGLTPGTQVVYHAAACDYKPQTGKSELRRLSVITVEELQERIAARQSLLLAELARVLKLQRDVRGQVEGLEIRGRKAGGLEPLDVDHLQAAELGQRQVDHNLASRQDGVAMHLIALLADLQNNRLDNPDSARHARALLREIERLERGPLPRISRELAAAIKSAQVRLQERKEPAPKPPSPSGNRRLPSPFGRGARGEGAQPTKDGLYAARPHPNPLPEGEGTAAHGQRAQQQSPPHPNPLPEGEGTTAASDAATTAALGRALAGQDEVIASLEAMLGQLREWDDYRHFHRDVAQLLRDQGDLARGAAEAGRLTLTREIKDLAPQETADLAVLAARQLELARRLDRIQQEMGQTAAELRQGDPLAADMLADAAAEAQRLALAAAMRSAAALVEENRIARAADAHKQISAGLQEVLDILANRRQQELARLVRKLIEAEGELRTIHARQQQLHKELLGTANAAEKAASATLAELGHRAAALRQETEQLARRLERLLAEQAGRVTRRAAGEMDDSGRAAAGQDRPRAVRAAENAEKSLVEAEHLLARRRLQAQTELALEELARLQDAAKFLAGRQRQALDETRRIEAARQRGLLSRTEAAALRDLAHLEKSLQAQAAGLAEGMAAAEAFRAVLATVAGDMGRAAEALDRGQTGPAAQQPEQDALARLDLVLRAIEPEKPGTASAPAAGGDGAGQQATPPGGVQTLSEIKLLKLLQDDISLRTERLSTATAGGEPTAGQPSRENRTLLADLGEEQGRLADLVLRLVPPDSKEKQGLDERLVSVARQMREVQGRLAQGDAGPVTRHVQQQIASDLEQMIDEARKLAAQPPHGAEPSTVRTPVGTPGPRPHEGPPAKSGTQPGGDGGGINNPERRKPDEHRQAEIRELRKSVLKSGSGIELPERERQQMLELPAEEALPQYEVLTEEYFRQLSQPKTGRGYEP
jgi:hypothetical protein